MSNQTTAIAVFIQNEWRVGPVLHPNLQLWLFRGDAAARESERITIPAVSVSEGAVGRVAADGPVESASPAFGVAGFDSLAHLRRCDFVADGLPCGERGAIDETTRESSEGSLAGVRSAQETLANLRLETVSPEFATVDICA